MSFAPIVIFLYNRPLHSEKTISSLAKNRYAKDSQLFVFIDGPKTERDATLQKQILKSIESHRCFFRSVLIEHSRSNRGLASSIRSGVSQIVKKYGKVIVLEDDIVTSPLFLEFMNLCLDEYEAHPGVYSVNAYMHPIKFKKNEIFLSSLATSSWGWATWEKKWNIFSLSEDRYETHLPDVDFVKNFNFGGIDYFSMLRSSKSWAIHWYYSVKKLGGLGVFSTRSYVKNIGFDGSGENCGISENDVFMSQEVPEIHYLKTENETSTKFRENIKIAYQPTKRKFSKIKMRILWLKLCLETLKKK